MIKNVQTTGLLFLIFLASIADSFAQVTLTTIEDFNVGDSLHFYTINPSGLTFNLSGSNVTWDYHTINAMIIDSSTQEMVAPATTAYSSDFPMANLVEKNSDGSLVFVEKTAPYSNVWGLVTSAALEIKYTPADPWLFIKRPFSYLDSFADTSHRTFNLSGVNNGIQYAKTVADGWGKLMLPGQTYDSVLRIRFEQVSYDTAVSGGTITQVIATTYAWFDRMHKSALFKVDSVIVNNPFYHDTSATVQYLKNEMDVNVGIKTLNGISPDITGTIENSVLFLNGTFSAGSLDIQLYNVSGQLLEDKRGITANRKMRVGLDNNFVPGIYVIRISSQETNERYKIKIAAR